MKQDNTKKRLIEIMQRVDRTFKPKLNEDLDQDVEEFIPHGSYTISNSGGYEIMLSDAGDAAKVRDAFGSDNPKTSDWLEIEHVPSEDGGEEFDAVIDPNGYNIPLNQVMRINNNINEEEEKDYDYYMSKERVDDEYVEWLVQEFELQPETIRGVAEISGYDPYETYDVLNSEIDRKGFGFDTVYDDDELYESIKKKTIAKNKEMLFEMMKKINPKSKIL